MDWFTDLLDTLVVMWFLFKPVFHFLSWASKPPVIIGTCLGVHEGGASQKMCGLFTPSPQEASSCFGLDLTAQWVLWNLESAWLASAASHSGSDVGMIARAGFPPDCFWSGIKGSWEKIGVEVMSSFRGPLGWNWARLLGSRLASTDRIIPSLGLVRITSKASEGFRKPRCAWVPTLECFPLTAIHTPVFWFECWTYIPIFYLIINQRIAVATAHQYLTSNLSNTVEKASK